MVRPLEAEPQQPGLGMDDFLSAVFKHKWKILACTFVGLLVAGAFYLLSPLVYESQAKLLVRYVLERSSIDPVEGSSGSGQTTDTVISSEVEILTSWDLAVQVAEAIGTKRLLPGAPAGASVADAAATIRDGLTVTAHANSHIIFVAYRNARPELASLVLEELVTRYFTKHLEVHRSAGAFDFVSQQTDQVRSRLHQTEDAIRTLKGKLGIISLTDSTEALSGELARIQDKFREAEAEEAEQGARVKQMEQMLSVTKSESAGRPKDIPASGNVQHYQALVARLAQLRGTELELLSKYTAGNVVVKMTQAQISALEEERRQLETKFPDLPATLGNPTAQGQPANLATEQGRFAGMKATTEMLRVRLRNVQDEIKRLAEATPQLVDLERNKELEETNYKYFEATLQKARIDEALDPSKIPNISAVQKPTPPMKVTSRRNKVAGELAGGGLALGLAFALFSELILKRTVKRSVELERRLGTSVLLSIPYRNGTHPPRWRLPFPSKNGAKPTEPSKGLNAATVAPWEPGHFIRRYSEAIRDRLGLYFELNQMTHKPKLIGVTSFSTGAGTSTLAAGLAAALSEMDEGKVLLVDVNLEHAAVHPFFAGRPASTLSAALEQNGPIPSAAENLYLATVASPTAGPMQRALKRFFTLMPNLKESDFDYIIFDLPPLTETNPTLGMATFMDKLLLVVEAEANNRDTVTRGYAELIANRANVSIVFNKAHTYIPKWLNHGS